MVTFSNLFIVFVNKLNVLCSRTALFLLFDTIGVLEKKKPIGKSVGGSIQISEPGPPKQNTWNFNNLATGPAPSEV